VLELGHNDTIPETNFKLFIQTIMQTLAELEEFVTQLPNVIKETRIRDNLIHSSDRLLQRQQLCTRVEQSINGSDAAPQDFIHCFGKDVRWFRKHISFEWKTRQDIFRIFLAKIAGACGIKDLHTKEKDFTTYDQIKTDFEDISWVPQHMSDLMEHNTLGAALACEYQVKGHLKVTTNGIFSNKFASAEELESYPWGLRKIFQDDDRAEYISTICKEWLIPQASGGGAHHTESLVRCVDKLGNSALHYLRRYNWLEPGGQRAVTVFVLFQLPESQYVSKKAKAREVPRAKKSKQFEAQKLVPNRASVQHQAKAEAPKLLDEPSRAGELNPMASDQIMDEFSALLVDVDDDTMRMLWNDASDPIFDHFLPVPI